jgi:hypothetical protein
MQREAARCIGHSDGAGQSRATAVATTCFEEGDDKAIGPTGS